MVNSASFDELFRQSGGIGAPPERTVEWKSPEHPAVHKALLSEPLQVDHVVGPIQVDRDEYLMVKVLGWRELSGVPKRPPRSSNAKKDKLWGMSMFFR